MVWAPQGLHFLVVLIYTLILNKMKENLHHLTNSKMIEGKEKGMGGACLHFEMHLANPLQRLEELIQRINYYSNAGCLRVKPQTQLVGSRAWGLCFKINDEGKIKGGKEHTKS